MEAGRHCVSTITPDRPAFLMCPPTAYAADRPANVWMEEMTPKERVVDHARAMKEFQALHEFVSTQASVFLLSPDDALSQQVFTASLGFTPPHRPGEVILSRFSDPDRSGETKAGKGFFKALGLKTTTAPASSPSSSLHTQTNAASRSWDSSACGSVWLLARLVTA